MKIRDFGTGEGKNKTWERIRDFGTGERKRQKWAEFRGFGLGHPLDTFPWTPGSIHATDRQHHPIPAKCPIPHPTSLKGCLCASVSPHPSISLNTADQGHKTQANHWSKERKAKICPFPPLPCSCFNSRFLLTPKNNSREPKPVFYGDLRK